MKTSHGLPRAIHPEGSRRKSRGFISLALALGIAIVAAAVLGGAGWWVTTWSSNTASSTPSGEYREINKGSEVDIGTQAVALSFPYGCYAKTAAGIYIVDSIPDGPFNLPASAKKVEGADVTTFQEVGAYGICFGKDKNNVYQDTRVLAGMDVKSFKLLWYAKGVTLFYQNGSGIIAFDYPGHVFKGSRIIEQGDAATFAELNPGFDSSPYAKDKNNVYCGGERIQYADPATPKLVDLDLSVTANGVAYLYNSTCHFPGTLKASPDSGRAPLTVTFTGIEPSAGARTLNFGDGSSVTDNAVGALPEPLSHTYAKPGKYEVTLWRSMPSLILAKITVEAY